GGGIINQAPHHVFRILPHSTGGKSQNTFQGFPASMGAKISRSAVNSSKRIQPSWSGARTEILSGASSPSPPSAIRSSNNSGSALVVYAGFCAFNDQYYFAPFRDESDLGPQISCQPG